MEKKPVGMFGWPYETSEAMRSLVSSGVFKDFPDIKFIIHHCGAMVPFFAERIRTAWPHLPAAEKADIKNPLDHFRKFYVDTAVYGNTAALMCGHAFFGTDHMLFGTDAPLGASSGEVGLTLETIRSVEQMQVPEADKQKIFESNVMKLLRTDL
jgi:predicted TIM-barrel fold metal-dependent hydrolase